MQAALARIQYARTVASNMGLRPWQRLMHLAHSQRQRADEQACRTVTKTAFRWASGTLHGFDCSQGCLQLHKMPQTCRAAQYFGQALLLHRQNVETLTVLIEKLFA